jgi:hypothetical protein
MLAEYSIDQAKSAEIYWTSDSSKVVIDEDNFRFMSIVVIIKQQSAELPLPKTQILSILGGFFERYRIHEEDGWKDEKTISLTIEGILNIGDESIKRIQHPFSLEIDSSNNLKLKP